MAPLALAASVALRANKLMLVTALLGLVKVIAAPLVFNVFANNVLVVIEAL